MRLRAWIHRTQLWHRSVWLASRMVVRCSSLYMNIPFARLWEGTVADAMVRRQWVRLLWTRWKVYVYLQLRYWLWWQWCGSSGRNSRNWHSTEEMNESSRASNLSVLCPHLRVVLLAQAPYIVTTFTRRLHCRQYIDGKQMQPLKVFDATI